MKLEKPEFVNEKPYSSKVRLVFLRHAEKAGADIVDALDRKVSLTEKGVTQAIGKGKESGLDHPLVVSSNRDRTEATGLHILASGYEEKSGENIIAGDESLEELKDKTHQNLNVGSYLLNDPRLDFAYVKGSVEHLEAQTAYEQGHYLQMLVSKHDTVVAEKSRDTESTYSKQAKNIALFIERYVEVSKGFNMVPNKEKKYDATLERIVASHGGILESFLAEAIEKIKGRPARDEFIHLFPNGFDFIEGFEVDIMTQEDGTIELLLKVAIPLPNNKSYTLIEKIPLEVLEKIKSNQ